MQSTYWNLSIYTVFISAEDLVLTFYSNKVCVCFVLCFRLFVFPQIDISVKEQDPNRQFGPFIYNWWDILKLKHINDTLQKSLIDICLPSEGMRVLYLLSVSSDLKAE